MDLLTPPRHGHKTFLFSDYESDLDRLDADIVFVGMPYGHPYIIDHVTNSQTTAPTAVRQVSDRVANALDRYDFDLGGPIFAGTDVRMVDIGDVAGSLHNPAEHAQRAETVIRKVLARKALPLIVGGDHAIPIPVLRAYDDQGPIILIQVDAHIDWRDHVNGVRDGLSSPIRRASEMSHIHSIYQIGIRGQGSARQEEVDAARAYGSNIITSYEVHDDGMKSVLARIPDGARYYITIDADGLDPSVMPGVEGPVPGGLTYSQVRMLINGLVGKGRVVGMDIVEIMPSADVNRISAVTAGRLFANLIGTTIRAGYFNR